jgi:MFS family permease
MLLETRNLNISWLGLTEAGLYPATTYLVTHWYRRFEVQVRCGGFFAGASLAGACSGLLAYGIGQMDGYLGYRAWRYIIGIEGLFTVAVGFIAPLIVINLPERAGSWLSEEERRFVILRQQYDSGPVGQVDEFRPSAVKAALLDWKVHMGIFMNLYVRITLLCNTSC